MSTEPAADPDNQATDEYEPDTAENARFHSEVEAELQDPDTAPGEDFAGAWIEPSDRGRVNIAFKGEEATERARRDSKKAKLARDVSTSAEN